MLATSIDLTDEWSSVVEWQFFRSTTRPRRLISPAISLSEREDSGRSLSTLWELPDIELTNPSTKTPVELRLFLGIAWPVSVPHVLPDREVAIRSVQLIHFSIYDRFRNPRRSILASIPWLTRYEDAEANV